MDDRSHRVARLLSAVACWAVRMAVAVQPPSFRHRFGESIVVETCDEIRSAVPRGAVATLRVSARALTDAWRGAGAERVAAMHPASPENLSAMRGVRTDLMIASRRVRSQPVLSVIVVVTLALAIGASTAIFSVADAVLLQPLPFPGSDRLVKLDEQTAVAGRGGLSFPALELIARETSSLEAVAFFEPRTAVVVVGDEPDRLAGATVSRSFFDVLRITPATGRQFVAGPLVGPPDEVVISHRLWLRLGGTSKVLGSSLQVEPRSYTIVGVMPPGFAYPADSEFWVTPPQDMEKIRSIRVRFLSGIGRLRREASVTALQAELAVLTERLPETDKVGGAVRMTGESLRESIVGHLRPGMTAVAAAAMLLLMIAVCNVTALLLGRATTRRKEIALQVALGASSHRLNRQSGLEVLLLTIPAGLAGIGAAWLVRDLIVGLSLEEVPRIAEVAIDARAMTFAMMTTLIAAALATILPARASAGRDSASALQGFGRSGGVAPSVLPALRGLVVGQVAMTLVMLVGGVLLARSTRTLASMDPGFTNGSVLTMRVNLPLQGFPAGARLAFYDEVRQRALAMPGVQSVAFSSRVPLADAVPTSEVKLAGSPGPGVRSLMHSAGPGLFETIGARIVEGREISAQDRSNRPVVVINEILAARLFENRSALGQKVSVGHWTGPVEAEVVGVARPVRYNGLAGSVVPEAYLDYSAAMQPLTLFVRTSEPADRIVPMLKAGVREADPTRRVTVDKITWLEDELARRLARPRFFLALVGTFGAVALVLAMAGLYGVMAFAVAQRRHEMGVRLALGASPRHLFNQVVGRGSLLVAIGIAIGLPAAAFAARGMRSLLFGIAPSDPLTFVTAILLVATVAIAACVVPARRAQATDPLDVLRVS
jgi:putative ABC transport system permease protein